MPIRTRGRGGSGLRGGAMSLWDLIQQIQIQNLSAGQISNRSEQERAVGRTRALGSELNDRIARVLLVTEAMWELISERYGITIEELAVRVRDIDARDGHIDNKHGLIPGQPQIRCPACQAVVPQGKTTCQFCGEVVAEAKADPFRL